MKRANHYGTVARALHWLIAALVMMQLASSLWMREAMPQRTIRMLDVQVLLWHKSLGLTVLVLSVARLVWRMLNPPPPPPPAISTIEQISAKAMHAAFYGLLIMLPLLGWAAVSTRPFGSQISWFGFFQWPRLPGLSWFQNKAAVEAFSMTLHRRGSYVFGLLIVLHVVAALKHHFLDRDDILARMLSPVRSSDRRS